jgi:two-component system NarL family response regulator
MPLSNKDKRPSQILVLVADDHALIRTGVVGVLKQDPLLEVVGVAQNGREAVLLAQMLEPDVVLMDLAMPAMGGLEATRVLRECCPTTSVLILTSHNDEVLLRDAIRAGAVCCLLKTASGEQLRRAVRSAATGIFAWDRSMLHLLLGDQTDESSGVPGEVAPPTDLLTRREREVLALVAGGMSNGKIAHTLIVRECTAKKHVENILTKLGVSNRTQAAVRAVELGYVSQMG